MTRALSAIMLTLFLTGCSIGQRNDSVHNFIPMNYTGWVNLIFNDSSKSAVEPLTFDNGYVYLVTGDPQFFRLKSDKFPPANYDMHYFYYNTDTTIELSWGRYPKQNIFFERTIGSKSKNIYRSSLYAFSFYVSEEPLNESGLSVDKLPKNKILE